MFVSWVDLPGERDRVVSEILVRTLGDNGGPGVSEKWWKHFNTYRYPKLNGLRPQQRDFFCFPVQK